MANDRRIVTVDYLESEGLNHKQDYFGDVFDDESTHEREIDLKDANDNTVGQIVAVPTEGIRYTNVLTPENATDGANKKYVDDIVGDIDTILGTMANDASLEIQTTTEGVDE